MYSMPNHLVPYGYVDYDVIPRAVPATRIRATYTPDSVGVICARGPTEAKALAALAAEVRRVAAAIDELAVEAAAVEPTPEPAVGNFVCDVCHTKSRGPLGAPCPFEHYPQGHAIAAPSAPTVTGVCQVEHDNWDGRMICGNPMPCPRHVRLP